jgi:hypothetical protein
VEYGYDQGDYDDEGNWVEGSGIEFANEEERATFAQEVADDEDPFGDDEEVYEEEPQSLDKPVPPPRAPAAAGAPPALDKPNWRQNMGGNMLPEPERPSYEQNIDGDVRAAEMRRLAAAGVTQESEERNKEGPEYDIFRKVGLYAHGATRASVMPKKIE